MTFIQKIKEQKQQYNHRQLFPTRKRKGFTEKEI